MKRSGIAEHDADSQQVEFDAAEQLAFYQFQSVHMPLSSAVAPWQLRHTLHFQLVPHQTLGKSIHLLGECRLRFTFGRGQDEVAYTSYSDKRTDQVAGCVDRITDLCEPC